MTSIQSELPVTTLVKTKLEIQKERFDLRIKELRSGQAKNVTMFSDAEYSEFIKKTERNKTSRITL